MILQSWNTVYGIIKYYFVFILLVSANYSYIPQDLENCSIIRFLNRDPIANTSVQWSRPMIIFAYISNDMYKCAESWQVTVTPAKKTLSPPRPRSTSLRPRKCYWEQRVGILRGIDIAAFAILPADVHIYTLLSDCIGKYMCLCSPFPAGGLVVRLFLFMSLSLTRTYLPTPPCSLRTLCLTFASIIIISLPSAILIGLSTRCMGIVYKIRLLMR